MRRKRRSVTPEEAKLWSHVVRDVAPLAPAKDRVLRKDEDAAPKPAHDVSSPDIGRRASSGPRPSVRPVFQSHGVSAAPSALHVDRGLERRIRRGLAPIEGGIDLHGMTQDEAYGVLVTRLTAARSSGKRCILVITGKGVFGGPAHGDEPRERGVLRRRFQDWVTIPPLADIVLGVREAHGRHGGGGAFYTFLRRSK